MPGLTDVQGYANALVMAVASGDMALVKQLNEELEGMTPDFRGGVAVTMAGLINKVLRTLADVAEVDEDDLRSQLLVAESGTAGTFDEILKSMKDRDPGQ